MASLTFDHFKDNHGVAGARQHFEEFVVRTVKGIRPTAKQIAANPGDWGIDAYVGSLHGGKVVIWQAKFFLDEKLEDSQKAQIRESFDRALKEAQARGYEVISWTLCIPQILDGPSSQWWDKFKAEHETKNLSIELWDLDKFRELMATEEAADLRLEFFPQFPGPHASSAPSYQAPPSDQNFEDMLFIRQLREAGIVALDSAKEQFYNAELVSIDLRDKGPLKRQNDFDGMRADLRSTWEDRFNHHCGQTEGDQLPGLHPDVMERIEKQHVAAPDQPFKLLVIHRKGALHQVVENGDAGWIRDYRRIVADHKVSKTNGNT